MPKHKGLLKPNPKAKSKAPVLPQSENDFLEAADEFEQSAGKWRAGDAEKATRFFHRAIDMYNEGLQKHPKSFDLAYNKANLEYNMIQDDRIAKILGKKLDLLQETLRSHRAAVALDPENTDALFNTGQVLTSLAEELIERGGFDLSEQAKVDSNRQARELLKEATDIFTKCLLSQQQEYEQIQSEMAMANAQASHDGAEQMGELTLSEPPQPEAMDTSSTPSDGGEWATVVEPITPESLLETCTAQLGALTSLLGESTAYDFSDIESNLKEGYETLNNRIPLFIKYMEANPSPQRPEEEPTAGPTLSLAPSSTEEAETSPKIDALIAAANFRASLLDSKYRGSDVRKEPTKTLEYAKEIEQLFTPLVSGTQDAEALDIDQINALSAYADALFEFATSVTYIHSQQWPDDTSPSVENLETQWMALSQAQNILTKLSTSPVNKSLSPSRLADVFSARGDTDLLRFCIASFESAKAAWAKSRTALASNACVFYRAARSYAHTAGAREVYKTVDSKLDVAYILMIRDIPLEARPSSDEASRSLERRHEAWRTAQVMCDDGVIGVEQREAVKSFYGDTLMVDDL